MKLRQVLKYKPRRKAELRSGFTLMELLMVMGIFALVFAWGLFASISSYRRVILSGERDNVIAILRRARSKAFSNVNQARHGVFFGPGDYTLFQGDSYASRAQSLDEIFPKSTGVTASGISEIVFEPLSGDSLASGTITLTNGIANSTATVNYEGRIDW